MSTETIFGKGFYFDRPREGAPDYVKGRLSVKVDEAVAFLQEHKNEKGYVNLDLLLKKDGEGLYFKLNTWKPTIPGTSAPYPEEKPTGDQPF